MAKQWLGMAKNVDVKQRQGRDRKEVIMAGKNRIEEIMAMYDKAGERCQQSMAAFMAGIRFAVSQKKE